MVAMVDPKTKIWTPRGRLTQWRCARRVSLDEARLTIRPRIDHVPHVLHSLKESFNTSSLRSITESESKNKHVWSCVLRLPHVCPLTK